MKLELQRLHTLKVLVGIPSGGSWMAGFGMSLANMMAAVSLFKIQQFKQQIFYLENIKGSILSKSRFLLVESAKKYNVDYLLMIDSDQTFSRKAAHLLIGRDLDVVGANVATKQLPAQPTARNKGPNYEKDKHDWSVVYTDPESEGVEKVDRIGCGILMLSKKAYSALHPSDWDAYYREDVETVQGEDWTMMEALEAKGFPVYVDHDVSKEVGHIGYFEFKHEHVGEIVRVPVPENDSVRDPQPRPLAQAAAAL